MPSIDQQWSWLRMWSWKMIPGWNLSPRSLRYIGQCCSPATITSGISLLFLMDLVHTCPTTTIWKCALMQTLSTSERKANRRQSTKPTTIRLQGATRWCIGNLSLTYVYCVLQTNLSINEVSSMLVWQRSDTKQIIRISGLICLFLSTFIQSTCSHFKSGASIFTPLCNHLNLSILWHIVTLMCIHLFLHCDRPWPQTTRENLYPFSNSMIVHGVLSDWLRWNQPSVLLWVTCLKPNLESGFPFITQII